ncbi:MAG: RluA family pseudouridine synthase [Clostridia bacterium]|nr:RluA family pseudouridine synthase [Clostridia bacterium]
MREINIGKNDAGQRLDKFLTKKFKNLPMSMMYKLIRKKKITVNRKRAKENQILVEGDLLLIFAPDDLFDENSPKRIVTKGIVNIAYEDENILIADKESGLLVHSDSNEEGDTLIDRITAYLIEKGEFNPENENSFAPALCNRIDRNTEGLVIAAKNAPALREMNEIIKERKIQKIYLAAVHGVIIPKNGEIKLNLQKDSTNNIVRVKDKESRDTKYAITKYNTVSISRNKDYSLLEIELITGRTHQIRASFAHIGHPLVGDGKYAVNKKDREIGYKSQALCAYSVTFIGCKKSATLGYLDGLTVNAKKPRFLSLF